MKSVAKKLHSKAALDSAAHFKGKPEKEREGVTYTTEMGCHCSKQWDDNVLPRNPLQQLKAAEAARDNQNPRRRRRQEQKRQRQLAKLQKRNVRKRRQQRAATNGRDSQSRLSHSHSQVAPQLRLRGGSNGSSATECISALYARTLEQQREEQQQSIEQRTRHQLERQLCTFLLNQLLLGIQFFGHFEHEMAAIDDELLAKLRACSQTLSEHSVLYAGAIDAAVAKRLLFKANDGTQRQSVPGHAPLPPEPLQKPLTYVIFDNVDVARPNDANYDSISALCKVLLETDYNHTTPYRAQYMELLEQTRWMGYVRLKLRDGAPKQKSSAKDIAAKDIDVDNDNDEDEDVDNEGIYTDGSSGYSTATTRCSWDEGDYDHVYIARLNTQRSLEELGLPKVQLERNVLPEECICRLGSCLPAGLEQSDDELDSSDTEDEQGTPQEQPSGYETVQVLRQCRVEQQRRRMLLQQCYLSSQQFMHYFGELLRQQLAAELCIAGMQLTAGSYRGCSVFTATEELVPAIHVPNAWPDCAFEFNLRSRPCFTNPQTGEQQQFPTAAARKRMQSFGFHVVPAGYAPKRSRNPFRQLEWRIIFPQAELYLERQLTRVQLKLLLVVKALVRSFVQDKCQAMGHLMEQLRTHLFWQCERNAYNWSEQFLGEQLVRFVRSFADCLARKQLSDYFIERRNLFEHVPEDVLMELRSIMAGIAEQPLLHVLQALRNLEHSAHFYPKLNYGQLLDTLVTADYLQLRNQSKFSRNPLLTEQQQEEQSKALNDADPLPAASDPQGLVGMRQHQVRTRGKLRRKTQLLRAQQQKRAKQRRNSSESLNLDLLLVAPRESRASLASKASSDESVSAASISDSACASRPQLNDGVEILRRTNLLEQLLDHMLAMLTKATEFRNPQHAQLYLEQAQLLCRLYQQLGCSQNAQHYADLICQAASRLERSSASSSASSGSSRRRSLKFVEHVAQVHTAGIPSPQRLSPPSTLRVPPIPNPPPAEIVIELSADTTTELQTELALDTVPAPKDQVRSTLQTLFQRIQLEPPVALQSLSSKTEQLVQSLELRDLLKRNKLNLKSVFN